MGVLAGTLAHQELEGKGVRSKKGRFLTWDRII